AAFMAPASNPAPSSRETSIVPRIIPPVRESEPRVHRLALQGQHPETHSWTRRSGSRRTNRSRPSTPRANSPRASDRFPYRVT
ncbi:MAG TPA: hypothetical protein VK797_18525, partial [Tepidisphaeraceae bacterium]|nr:hypothetical protein [Tepidisphaeraceae bacterium]